MNNNKSIGFIIIRHVSSKLHDLYWKKSYENIRKYYENNEIIIIDDYSNYEYIDKKYEEELKNCKIINSEFKGRGELLLYYYFLEKGTFDIAVCIHDSVFINKKLEIDDNMTTCKFLWHFEHYWDNITDEKNIINKLNNCEELLLFYDNKTEWKGCFGGMSIINKDFLKKIDEMYEIKRLLPYITNRNYRMCFERIIACIMAKNTKTSSIFGDINTYCPWGLEYKDIERYNYLPLIKIWSGR